MARPIKQATCHPERRNKAYGLCHNCYMNARHATPEGKQKRHDYYIRNKATIAAKARDFYAKNRPRQIKLATARTKRRRAAQKVQLRVFLPKAEVPVSELPRETPKGSSDKKWWQVSDKEKPNQWLMGT